MLPRARQVPGLAIAAVTAVVAGEMAAAETGVAVIPAADAVAVRAAQGEMDNTTIRSETNKVR
jgi:hypothetical protein